VFWIVTNRRGVFFGIMLLFLIVSGNTSGMAKTEFIPVSLENAPLLLEKVIQAKLIPYQIDKDGLKLTVTKLLRFSMDWDNSQLLIECGFNATYQQGFINLNQSGAVLLSGNGLLSPTEQKLGCKLVQIKELRLDKMPAIANSTARYLLDKGLAGREFWYGQPPVSSCVLNRDNFAQLVQIAVSQKLPITKTLDRSEFALKNLSEFGFMKNPGQIRVILGVSGTYHQLVSIPFEGEVGLESHLTIDPDQLTGIVKIDRITSLRLKNIPGVAEGLIRSMINSKIAGDEYQFSWQ
jgi:hypothetical protein